MDDLRAVLDEIGSREVVLIGYSEGGALCLMYATTYPERTRGILLVGAFARWMTAPGYAAGWSHDELERLRAYITRDWGAGETVRAIVESRAHEPTIQAWAARMEQEGGSPGAALQLLDMNVQVDVRPLLPIVSAPTVVLHHKRDAVIRVESARYLASRLPSARLVEVEGRDHSFMFEGWESFVAAIEALLAMPRSVEASFLTTIVALRGDSVSDPRTPVEVHGGQSVGDGLFSFDGPQRAIRFAAGLVRRDPAVAVGVHAGEVSRRGSGLEGAPVEVSRRLAELAKPGEMLVSRVLRDLVPGSGLDLQPHGTIAQEDGTVLEVLKHRS